MGRAPGHSGVKYPRVEGGTWASTLSLSPCILGYPGHGNIPIMAREGEGTHAWWAHGHLPGPLGIHPAQVLQDLPGVRVTTGHIPLPSTPIPASLRRGDIWQTQKKSPTLGALPCRPCSSSLALEISLKLRSKIKHKPPKPKFYTQHLLFPEDPRSCCGIAPKLSLSKNPILHIKTLMQFVPGFAEVPPPPHGCSGDWPASARLGSRGGTGPHGGFSLSEQFPSPPPTFSFSMNSSASPRTTASSANANPDVAAHICAHLGSRYQPRRLGIIQLGAFNHLVRLLLSFFFSRYLAQTAQSQTLRLSRAMPPGKRRVRL